jgi:precorrin-8X/cobalt-precorrin-8 methylmutase
MTRSMAAVDIAVQKRGESVCFGNAPTALFRLLEHASRSAAWLACRSVSSARRSRKRRSAQSGLPGIAALGRKGGSNVAAAIVNAILYHLRGRDERAIL